MKQALPSSTTIITIPAQYLIEDSQGTANPSLNLNGRNRTIGSATTALHTAIPLHDLRFTAIHLKYSMGANLKTHPAADASQLIQFKGNHIW